MASVKAQISLFIIIGLVVVVVLAFFGLVLNKAEPTQIDLSSVKSYMDNCIEQRARMSMDMAGKTAGRFTEEIYFTAFIDESNKPSLMEMGESINSFFRKEALKCADHDFAYANVTAKSFDSSVSFHKNNLVFSIEDPYEVNAGNQVFTKDNLQVRLDIRFQDIYKTMEHIIKNKPLLYDKGPLLTKNLDIELIEQQDFILCAITDRNPSKDYIFTFAYYK